MINLIIEFRRLKKRRIQDASRILADANMRSKTIQLIKLFGGTLRASQEAHCDPYQNSETKFNEFEVAQLLDNEAVVTMLKH